MLKTQKRYLDYLEQQGATLRNSLFHCPDTTGLREAIEFAELLVPVIGSFSAGKSSLINAFIGRDLLPVGIKPETELATELRHAEQERLEAVTREGRTLSFEIEEMASLKARAAEFSHLRLWVRSDALARIAPLVLVDMPGFDSTLENHNKAIANYIEKGTHYLVVVSVESGGITRSMERQIADIHELGRDFSLVLSKTNLRADSEVDEVATKIEEQAEDAFGSRRTVQRIGLDGAAQFSATLGAIEPERVVQNLFGTEVKRTYFEITESINATLAALKANSSDNAHAVDEMAAHLLRIERKREDLIADVEARYSASAVRRCVEEVGRALEQNMHELVEAGTSANRDALSRVVTEIVRGALIRKIKAQMNEIGQKIVTDFSLELGDIDALMSAYTSDGEWASHVTANASQLLEQAGHGFSRLGEILSNKDKAKAIYRVATTIVAVTTNVVFPLLELVIIFLPDLLAPFFEARRRETIENTIRTTVIPGIKSSLHDKLPEIFKEQVALVIGQVGAQFESAIADKKAAIEKLEQERRDHQNNLDQQDAQLRALQERLNALTNEYLNQSDLHA